MCDFKPGDEVIAITTIGSIRAGQKYIVANVRPFGMPCWSCRSDNRIGVVLRDVTPALFAMAYCPVCELRKVQRRNIEAWLETATDFEEPKRVPAGEDA